MLSNFMGYTRNLTKIWQFQVSIDFWATSEGLPTSDFLSFSNFEIIETHEGESVNLPELKGYPQAVVLP